MTTLDSWWLDVKLGIRIFIKHPGLALVGVFGIAVAIAIAAGGFSVIYRNFLAPSLPFEEGDRIVSIQIWDSAANKPELRILHDYQVWRKGLKSIQEIGAFRTITPNLTARGAQPESVSVALMSASGFRVTRVRPLLGRYLVDEDEREGAASVIVIGENVWRNRFGSDPAVLGQTIQLGSTPFSIVGVMPDGFAFPINHRFWAPLRTGSTSAEPLSGPDLTVFGKLAPGATLESARAELAAITRTTALSFPEIYAQLRPQLKPYASPIVGSFETQNPTDLSELLMMNLPAAMVLVLVCLNVGILVYTRTAMRQGEISIRTALGASRRRIVAQLFVEALVLSVAGAVLGIVIAALALLQITAATQQIALELPFWISLRLSPVAVLYAGLLSVVAAAIVGIVPALKATRRGVQAGARIIGADGSGMRFGGTWTLLVVAQVGFAVTLLPAAVFNAWDNIRAEFADPGFAAEEFLTAQLGMDDMQRTDRAAPGTAEFSRRYASRLAELKRRLEAEPRVSSTTFSMSIPGDEPNALLDAQGLAVTARLKVRFNRVDLNFFRALGVPMLAGRGFEPADVAPTAEPRESGVVVVNQSFAQQIFGGDALGRRIRYADRSRGDAPENAESGRWYEIVGIVRDFPDGVSPGMLESPLRLYHPVAAGQVLPVTMAIRVRGGDPSTFARRLSDITAAVDPDLHLRSILSLHDALRKEQWIRRLESAMLGSVSMSVLLLSSAGIYALMSFAVSQRRKEIGIRIALGADRRRIIASIFSRALGQLAAGAGLGVAAAAALEKGNHLMRGHGAVVLPAVALFMMAVGFVAALGPARRGLRIEPTEALKEQ
jgi:putative ABC transport system permease protein